ncbi:MAG: ribonuclease III [Synergistaceae bacterium]|nr:ribonuclease III [Synergistaceae bacterium]
MNEEQSASRSIKLHGFEERLGYVFNDRELLNLALCHSSYANENGLSESNERLEFLGDAVIELTVSHLLFSFFHDSTEGELTRKRANIVCHESLVKWGQYLNIQELILRGKSLRNSCPDSIYSDAVEAVIGAVYIDGGYDEAFRIVKRHVAFFFNNEEILDHKSRLQTFMQIKKNDIPVYEIISIEGPSHAPQFKVRVIIDDKEWTGEGLSKKAAEASAAYKAIRELETDEKIK